MYIYGIYIHNVHCISYIYIYNYSLHILKRVKEDATGIRQEVSGLLYPYGIDQIPRSDQFLNICIDFSRFLNRIAHDQQVVIYTNDKYIYIYKQYIMTYCIL